MQEPREFRILRRIWRDGEGEGPPVVVGPGDDAAVLRPPAGRDLVFTTDTLSESVHFAQSWCPADALGFKAVVQSLSDLAAMGARPLALCAALSMPASTSDAWVDGFLEGLGKACSRWTCPLVGGNLSRAPEGISVTVSLLGTVAAGDALLRSGGRPGDALLLTGWPGLAASGLGALARDARAQGVHVDRFLRPTPCLEEIRFLREETEVRACIDTSDSLSLSLGLLAEASGLAARADGGLLPLHPLVARDEAAPGLAAHGGEDFEILCAAPDRNLDSLCRSFAERFGRPLTKIGSLETGRGTRLAAWPPGEGFAHFRDGEP